MFNVYIFEFFTTLNMEMLKVIHFTVVKCSFLVSLCEFGKEFTMELGR